MAIHFTDDLGVAHDIVERPRILSLVPSITELLFDLDLAEQLVGRTQYCIHPDKQVASIPSVGGTKKINMSRVKELAPTHAIMNIDENPKSMADDLEDLGVDVVTTHPMKPTDNLGLYQLIGGVFNRPDQTAQLANDFRKAMDAMPPSDNGAKNRVLYLIWKDPWMAVSADTYIANTLALVNWHIATPGMIDGQTGDAARYPKIDITNKSLENINLVLFSSEPYSFSKDDIGAFQSSFPDHGHKAHIIDGEMTSWYGSRAIKGLKYLREFADQI